MEGSFEGVNGRYSAYPVTLNVAPHLVIQVELSSWPSLHHVPMFKLPVDRESKYHTILASASGGWDPALSPQ